MSPPGPKKRAKSPPAGLALPPRPAIYEINTRLWLRELSRRFGESITLGNVPAAAWDEIAAFRFDAVWLMGVWQRSPAGLELALANEALRRTLAAALPDVQTADIAASPFCVRDYAVDGDLGGSPGLAAARAALAERGMGLILDFVPNHVAPDHPWLADHPDYFIAGTAEDLAAKPDQYFEVNGRVIAHGRDPNFPPWPDVAQLNAFSPALRRAMIATLLDVAAQCDGLRCDMAALMTTDAFLHTWGERAGDQPEVEYWREILPAVRAQFPHLRLIAEAHGDMEWELMQQGFDFCYDKRLYARLVYSNPVALRDHLTADPAYQEQLVRYVENHYEARAAATFGGGRALTNAVAAYTLPGAKLFHQGQFEGLVTRLPVFLTRRPEEPIDRALAAFYRRLVNAIQHPALRDGQWRLCALNGWPDNTSYNNLAAWCWEAGDERRVIVVNLSPHTSQARVQLPWPDLAGQNWVFIDVMDDTTYEWGGDEMLNMGLFVELAPWGRHFFAVR